LTWESAASEVRHGNSEIPSRVNKFAWNLHVLKTGIEAEKERFHPGFKTVRVFALVRPLGQNRFVAGCAFVLQ
jgi:hypothetical protein